MIIRELTENIIAEFERLQAENVVLTAQNKQFTESPNGNGSGGPRAAESASADEVEALRQQLASALTEKEALLKAIVLQGCGNPSFDGQKMPAKASSPDEKTEIAAVLATPVDASELSTNIAYAFADRLNVSAGPDEDMMEKTSVKGLGPRSDRIHHVVHWNISMFVKSSSFEVIFLLLILTNAVIIGMETQYKGFEAGYDLSYPGYPKDADGTWPGMDNFFEGVELVFGTLFAIELMSKVFVYHIEFFKYNWNYFDATVVLAWFVSMFGGIHVINPLILRLMRLGRLVRLARMLRSIEALDSLQILIGAIIASAPILLWSTVLLFLVQMLVGLILHSILMDFIEDDSEAAANREVIFSYFGTFSRTMISMFELSLGNWIPICRTLMENVSEWYGVLILAYKLIVGFAVVKVISAVFMHETFKAAQADEDLVALQKKRAEAKLAVRLKFLFHEADASGDGFVQKHEFFEICKHPDMLFWLSSQDVEIPDPDLIFDMIDAGSNRKMISANQLMRGITRLKSHARTVDLFGLMHVVAHLQQIIHCVERGVQKVSGDEERRLGDMTVAIDALSRRLSDFTTGTPIARGEVPSPPPQSLELTSRSGGHDGSPRQSMRHYIVVSPGPCTHDFTEVSKVVV
eukprot:NODE_49_length_2421_cov_227.888419.p1 GENE.NODE_49_length_2421_cov_227.888419~~NODE_49_length_2421_cov_227.888419.p1  ORF type:complete len:635 (-),score=215.31 NODE_49_length_2421_cov_227.888419:384-2288(-)